MTGAGLYVHIPFCEVKCSYCDFLSGPAPADAQEAYLDTLEREATSWQADAQGGRLPPMRTLFVGGGTPSLLTAPQMARVMTRVVTPFGLPTGAESTWEANPESIDAQKIRVLMEHGVNRLSLGIQSLDPQELAFLGRIHTAPRALEAIDLARSQGIGNLSVDLIYGFPGHTSASWTRTLDGVLAREPEHVSAYAFILEEGTRLAHLHQRGELSEPDPDLAADLFEITRDRLGSAGYNHYEISNYARPGFQCRHNVGYWQNAPYLGLGMGAVSFLSETRRTNARSHEGYRRQVAAGRRFEEAEAPLAPEARVRESLWLGLRMIEGVDPDAVAGGPIDAAQMAPILTTLDRWVARGLLTRRGNRYAPSRQGVMLLNEVMVDLV